MGTCVIAADMLNGGYQSMQVWHGGRKGENEQEGEIRARERKGERKGTSVKNLQL